MLDDININQASHPKRGNSQYTKQKSLQLLFCDLHVYLPLDEFMHWLSNLESANKKTLLLY